MDHCKYGYSCISLAHTGVFSSSPPTTEITSCPFATRRTSVITGTATLGAALKCSGPKAEPQLLQITGGNSPVGQVSACLLLTSAAPPNSSPSTPNPACTPPRAPLLALG